MGKVERILQLIVIVGAGALLAVFWEATRDKVVRVGDQAPEFSITTSNNLTLSRSNFGGRVLVLNFWATWCPPCVQEMPALERLSKQLRDSGVVVIGISVDKNEQKYHNFIRRFNLTFATAHDPAGRISGLYGTYRYPETYVIDARGKVVQKIIGQIDWTDESVVNFLRAVT